MSGLNDATERSWPLHSDDLLKIMKEAFKPQLPGVSDLMSEESRIRYAVSLGSQEIIEFCEALQARTVEEKEELIANSEVNDDH